MSLPWFPTPAPCVRAAWLTLPDGSSISLEQPSDGWFCTGLDIAFPAVREVISNRPDQDGADDRTQFFGARAVAARISAVAGAGARIDQVASMFAPFMQPSARPTLHYVLDRPGAPERTLTVRPAGYAFTVAGDQQRDIALQFVAGDPYLYDPTVQTVTAWAGSSTANGRVYSLTFNRTYPTGGGVATVGHISPAGDLPIQPLLRIYGPITAPRVHLLAYASGSSPQTDDFNVAFVSGFIVNAGEWVDVDTDRRTAYRNSDPTQSAFGSLNFATTTWPVLPGAPGVTNMYLLGAGTISNVTQVQAIWQDAYLS